MRTHVARTLADVENIKEFVEGKTCAHARRFLAGAPENPFADHLRWLEDDGRPVACVQVFVHQYPIGCAQMGMCLPEYPFVPPELRGRGYFKQLMTDLFDWMRKAGYPLAYDHGRKGLYTSAVGYAPCFHHCMVLLRVKDALNLHAAPVAEKPPQTEVEACEELFRQPFPLGRGLQCRDERWRPDAKCVRLVRADDEAIRAFAVLGEVWAGHLPNGGATAGFKPPEGNETLTVMDSWAADVAAAAGLLRAIAEEAKDLGFNWIRINCRRDDPLARVAVLTGGELRWCAAQERSYTDDGEDVDAFYLADLPLAVKQMLPELNTRWKRFASDAPSAIRLRTEDEEVALRLARELAIAGNAGTDAPCIHLPRKAMARAIMGYATPTELSLLHEGCDIPEACRIVLDALFIAREPHLFHEGYAFAKPHELGLVP